MQEVSDVVFGCVFDLVDVVIFEEKDEGIDVGAVGGDGVLSQGAFGLEVGEKLLECLMEEHDLT